MVVPGSQQVKMSAEKLGLDKIFGGPNLSGVSLVVACVWE